MEILTRSSGKLAAPHETAQDATDATAKPLPRPATVTSRIMWSYVIGVGLLHLLLPLAFMSYFFSWIGLALVPVGNYFFCSLGIGAGYHRLLTHRGYRCAKWLEHTLAVMGVCCLQDSPARWVAIHRLHHQHSDEQPDPHSPKVSAFWGHVGWLFIENSQLSRIDTYDKYARDILRDPFYFSLERSGRWATVYIAHAVAILLLGLGVGWLVYGTAAGTLQMGLLWLFWGVVVRTVYTWHVTWGVNSVAHLWGYRNYETSEDSRNNWLVALATNGDGWHNNHHSQPRSARHGHRWWELDVTWLTICLWERMGLVTDVIRPKLSGAAEQRKNLHALPEFDDEPAEAVAARAIKTEAGASVVPAPHS